MVTVPVAMPFTTPDDEPIDAIEGLLLLHMPPEGIALHVVVLPVQATGRPYIDAPSRRTRWLLKSQI